MDLAAEEVKRFWQEQGACRRLLDLFQFLPDACICVKDRMGKIVWANQAEAALHGFRQERHLLGKTDFDLYEKHLAAQYVADDQRLMISKTPSWNRIWLLSDHFRKLQWFICSKVPLYEEGQDAIGIAIMMRQLGQTQPMVAAYSGMEIVLSTIVNHHAEPIRVQDLAKLVFLSHSQFDRRFKDVFQQTPQQYILQVRLRAACHALCHTNDTIAEIAARTGFSDQAHLTRQFRRELNMTPQAYRQQFHNRPR